MYLWVLVAILFFIWRWLKDNPQKAAEIAQKMGIQHLPKFIPDKYKSLEEVQEALRKAGLESSNLIIGIDYTKSNEWTGKRTFNGRCMHEVDADKQNPYQQVINIIGKTLEVFDDDKQIPAFGFGDETTKDRSIFPFYPERPCYTFNEVLNRYTEITPHVTLAGPTSFAPIIYEAINIVKENKSYHILVIIADGQVTNERETINAIVEASKYPLSIVLVGVGGIWLMMLGLTHLDGPWETMKEFDDGLPERKFDNFQFVNFHEVSTRSENAEVAFAVAALQEIPDQFKEIKRLKLL